MSFNYVRDQYEIQLQNIQGETLLYNYGDYFADASEIPVISEGDILQIDSDGQNKAGKIVFSDLVSFSIPDGGRIVVFSPEFSLVYDSLTADSHVTYVEKDSYVVAVGKAGDTFKITKHELFTDISGHWAEDYINQLASFGMVTGTKDKQFQPDKNITGLNFLELLQRATGISPEDLATYGKKAISYKSEQAITTGQAISILADVMALAGVEANLTPEEEITLIKDFSDLEGIDYELKWKAALLIKLDIFPGRGNKLLAPENDMTSGEAAANDFEGVKGHTVDSMTGRTLPIMQSIV